MERYYREIVKHKDLVDFQVKYKTTDLFVSAEKNICEQTKLLAKKYRKQIQKYISNNPKLASSLKPFKVDRDKCPDIIRDMFDASFKTGVGPMASVAGAISEYVGKDLLKYSSNIIVENGGDIFLNSKKDRIIGVYAGESSLFNRVGIRVKSEQTPCGICTSSGVIGHSRSFGKADAVVVFSDTAILADAAATAACNYVKTETDIEEAIQFVKSIKGVWGVIVVFNDNLGSWGAMDIVDIKK